MVDAFVAWTIPLPYAVVMHLGRSHLVSTLSLEDGFDHLMLPIAEAALIILNSASFNGSQKF